MTVKKQEREPERREPEKPSRMVRPQDIRDEPRRTATDGSAGQPLNLKRTRLPKETNPKPEPTPVSAGVVERIVDLTLNPSYDKIREVTIIDRVQGKLLPQLDVIDLMWSHIFEVAAFRQDSGNYSTVYKKVRPEPPSLIAEFTHRTAQWQKSIAGTNLKSAFDLALAETESQSNEEEPFGGHGFDQD